VPRTARESHYGRSGHSEKPTCRDVMAPRRREIVPSQPLEVQQVELGDFCRFSRDCRERVPESHSASGRTPARKDHLLDRQLHTTPSVIQGSAYISAMCQCAMCLCMPGALQIIRFPRDREPCRLPACCWLDRPGGRFYPDLMQSQSTWMQ
jgi:hypothetical protein